MTTEPESGLASPMGPFHVHAQHPFEGFEIAGPDRGSARLHALCSCGVVLDVADAVFRTCPDCGGGAGAASTIPRGDSTVCTRCGGSGLVIDHSALCWHVGTKEETHDRH